MSLRFLVESHYARVRGDAEFWRPHIEEIASRHGLSMSTYEPPLGDATNAVFFVGDVIVKIYTPFFHGRESKGMEPAALRALATDSTLPVPKVKATGELFVKSGDWNWPYAVLTRVPGRVLEADWAGMGVEARLQYLRELGGVLAKIHKIPPTSELGEAYRKLWPLGFQNFLARQLEELKNHPETVGLPIAENVRDFQLPPIPSGWPMILHGDIEPAHLFHENGRFSGIVDFGDAKLGDPLYDFVAIRLSIAQDRTSLDALFDAYGSDPRTTDEGRLKLGLYTILHEWTTMKDLTRWCARSGVRTIEELGHWLWT